MKILRERYDDKKRVIETVIYIESQRERNLEKERDREKYWGSEKQEKTKENQKEIKKRQKEIYREIETG